MLERHWHIVRAGPHTTRLAWRAAAKSGAIGGRNGSRRNRALWSASIDGVLHATARRALEHHVVANGGVFRGTATTIVVPATRILAKEWLNLQVALEHILAFISFSHFLAATPAYATKVAASL